MTNDNNEQFKNAIEKALEDFNQRLQQQSSFQIQNILLQKLQEKLKAFNYYASNELENLSLEYEDFYRKLQETGKSYEDIVAEKNLVDLYSALEKFLFDCFYALYFPKFIGDKVQVKAIVLFADSDIELCRKNFIESHVKSIIQANNIKEIIDEFDKKFDIKVKKIIFKEQIDTLYEIALIRNMIIHNNSNVNRVYIELVKKELKNEPKYSFTEGETVLSQLPTIVDDMEEISTKICEHLAEFIIEESSRLERHHVKLI